MSAEATAEERPPNGRWLQWNLAWLKHRLAFRLLPSCCPSVIAPVRFLGTTGHRSDASYFGSLSFNMRQYVPRGYTLHR